MSDSFAAVAGSFTIERILARMKSAAVSLAVLSNRMSLKVARNRRPPRSHASLVQRLAFLVGDSEGRAIGDGEVETVDALAHLLADFGIVFLQVALEFRCKRAVAGRHAVIGGALEHGQMGGLFGDHRDRLDRG